MGDWLTGILGLALGHIGTAPISLFLLNVAVFVVVLAVRIFVLVKTYLLFGLCEKYQPDSEIRFTFNGIFQYTLILVDVLAALGTRGINFSSLTVLAGVAGVGIREQRPTTRTEPAPFARFLDFGDSSLDSVLLV